MKYRSTRDGKVAVSAAEAISRGISKDGGLFVPENLPKFGKEEFDYIKSLDYIGRAKYVLKYFLDDFTDEELTYCVDGAYRGTFENELPAPLCRLGENQYLLELWHGPTCAFKDLALQLLPFLMTTSAKKVKKGKNVILVATSGDTGKAALEGFKDVENTDIIVFYPDNGVSPMQKLQMDTQKGKNVHVCSIKGNFDDAQSGVKKIFTDHQLIARLEDKGYEFSSANSINWGRLVPQIVYYISAYCDLLNTETDLSGGFNVVVPTGNFGNILAAYYAKQMGVPVNKLVCASNANNILTDFLSTGVYDRNRNFYTTISPSMDILISSNLERMIYHLYGNNAEKVAEMQNRLAQNGRYEVDGEELKTLKELYFGGFCDDEMTLKTIKNTFEEYGYLIDTHTAVALNVCEQYKEKTKDTRPCVVVSTASPYKFAASVLKAIAPEKCSEDEFEMINSLSCVTNTIPPLPLISLSNAEVRFNNVCDIDKMAEVVINYLKI